VRASITGQNVVIGGSQIVHGNMTIHQATAGHSSTEPYEAVRSLRDRLLVALRTLPAGDEAGTTSLRVAAEDALSEAAKEPPDAARLASAARRLREAAETIAAECPTVREVVSQIQDAMAQRRVG
jgi:hypothetical protein